MAKVIPMYNDMIVKWLAKITDEDYLPDDISESDKVCIAAGSDMNQVVITMARKHVYFSVVGSPYLMAMTKWLQQQLIKEDIVTLKQQTISTLVDQFHLPSYKRQDALLILSLIEQINAT